MVLQKDFNATIATALGMKLDEVIYSPSGRPFMVAGHKEDRANGQHGSGRQADPAVLQLRD